MYIFKSSNILVFVYKLKPTSVYIFVEVTQNGKMGPSCFRDYPDKTQRQIKT